MDDLERRLASRLGAYEQSVPAADAPGAAAPAPHRFGWAAVAIVVVLAAGIGLVGSRLLTGVRPVANRPVAALTWTTQPFIEGARVVELKAIGTRLIATGAMAAVDGTSADRPAAWYSDDGGATWAASSVEAPSGGPEGAAHGLGRVVEHDGRLLALDAYTFAIALDLSSGASTLGAATTAVWSSTDNGASWALAQAVPGSVGTIAADPQRIIVLGTGEGGVAVGWQSHDGSSWQPLPLDGMAKEAYVADVAYDGSAFVSVGSVSVRDGDNPDERAPAAWRSVDGQTWSVTQLAPIGSATAVYADGSSIIAAGGISMGGQELSGTAVIWRPSRAAWTAQSLPSSPSGSAAATGIVANDLGSLARVQTGGGRGFHIAQELWFTATAEGGEASEQGLGIQVSAMASLPDRFVVISNCGVNMASCSSSVSIGTGVASPSSSASASAASSSPTPSSIASASGWITTAIGDSGSVEAMGDAGDHLLAAGPGMDGWKFWTSSDGVSWAPADIDSPPELASGGVEVQSLLWTGTRWVAGGIRPTDESQPAILTSTDGTNWEWADIPGAGECGAIERIVALGDRLLALGLSCVDGIGRGVLLTSIDGITWTNELVGSGLDRFEPLDATPTSDGYLAVGTTDDNDHTAGAIWLSSAGKGEVIAAFTDAAMFGITKRAGVYVAVGVDSRGRPAAWRSTNGTSWSVVPICTGCAGQLKSVVATEDAFYAFGETAPTETRDSTAMVFESSDGRSWHRDSLEGLASGLVKGALSTRFGPIAFGTSEDEAGTPTPVIVTLIR